MTSVGVELLQFMRKWSGRSGRLVLVNLLRRLGVTDVNSMTHEQKCELVNTLANDYLMTFLGQTKVSVARSELLRILGLDPDAYNFFDRRLRT
jgi:hypothetical protein